MHQSSSPDNEPSNSPSSTGINHPLLPTNSPLLGTSLQFPQYSDRDGDEVEGQGIELGSVSSPSDGTEDLHPSVRWVDPEGASRSSNPENSDLPLLRALSRWISGPQPSRHLRIEPLLPRLQNLPIAFLDAWFSGRRRKVWLFAVVSLCWLMLFTGILSTSILGCHVSGYSSPTRLSCISRFW